MEETIEFTASTPEFGDCTKGYDVKLRKKLTLEEFVNTIITENSKEWGQVERWERIGESNYKHIIYVEYRYGEIKTKNPEYENDKNKTIKKIISRGGWSSMDYNVIEFE